MDIERVLVTTSNFHHFEIKIVFRKSDGRVGYKELSKVYYRFGYDNAGTATTTPTTWLGHTTGSL